MRKLKAKKKQGQRGDAYEKWFAVRGGDSDLYTLSTGNFYWDFTSTLYFWFKSGDYLKIVNAMFR